MMKYSLLLIGALLLSCSDASQKLQLPVVITGESVSDKLQDDFQDPRVDILFVVDNSGSMEAHQRNLSANIDRFLNAFSRVGGLDYHLGVVSTDMDSWGGQSGRLQGNPKFVTNQTPNLVNTIKRNILLGVSGSSFERSFDPVQAAITPPLVNGANAGFFRDEAFLAIIFITDAEDQSNIDPTSFYNFLVKLKGDRPDKILGYGVIVPSNVSNCQRDDGTLPQRIETFLSTVVNNQDNVMSLCDPNYGDKLGAIGLDLAKRVKQYIYLKRIPVLNSIKVTFGNWVIPRRPIDGWMFDAGRNAIILGDEIPWNSQPYGSKLRISYEGI
jgi:hypothetical protein